MGEREKTVSEGRGHRKSVNGGGSRGFGQRQADQEEYGRISVKTGSRLDKS